MTSPLIQDAVPQERYRALQAELAPWASLWGCSVLESPDVLERGIPQGWFDWGAQASEKQQYELVIDPVAMSTAPAGLRERLAAWRAFESIPRLRDDGPSSRGRFRRVRGVTPKKRHEIERILGFFHSRNLRPRTVLDVGGGAGYLAERIAAEWGCEVDSVDRDAALQARGGARAERSVSGGGRVRFLRGEFPAVPCREPGYRSGRWDWSLGLHTCGPLAWEHLMLSGPGGPRVLNLACCYERLSPAHDTGLSQVARNAPLPWTGEALFLATRGGRARTAADFCFQQRVLRYRFSLHALLEDAGLLGDALGAVGSASDAAYRASFADYVRDRASAKPELRAAVATFSDSALESFARSRAPQTETRRFATLLRNALARPLELALLWDRAAALEELGDRRVSLIELFDASLSPRNVAVVVEPINPGANPVPR